MPIEVWFVFAGLALLLLGAGWGKWRLERGRARVREELASALGFPFEQPSLFELVNRTTGYAQQVEGAISGFPVRVTVFNSHRTEIRLGLREALPGNLRILPRGELSDRLKSLELQDPELASVARVLAEDSVPVRSLLSRPEVRDLLIRLFRTHPDSRLSSGELVLQGHVAEPRAVRRTVDHALALAEALGQVPGEPPRAHAPAAPVGLITQAGLELGHSMVQGLASAMSEGGSSLPTSAPATLGPIGSEEARLRTSFQKIQARAAWAGILPMGIGGALMVVNRGHGGSMGAFLAGFALLGIGYGVYAALMRCPQCEGSLNVWRYLFPSECQRCALRLR